MIFPRVYHLRPLPSATFAGIWARWPRGRHERTVRWQILARLAGRV